MVVLKRKAYAKLNLAFEVLGRRGDGYHEVRTVLQTIELCDDLEFLEADVLETRSEGLEIHWQDNLVYKAACSLQRFSASRPGASIHIRKGIPISAGLGGGSADAAATLNALNDLWRLNLSPDVLHDLASELGVDIPFLLCGGTGFGFGRGDLTTFLPRLCEKWLVIVVPPHNHSAKTEALYSVLRERHWSDGSTVDALVKQVTLREPIAEELMVNTFEQVAELAYPGFSDYRDRLARAVPGRPHLSGSGPALYAFADDQESGSYACATLRSQGLVAFLVRTI